MNDYQTHRLIMRRGQRRSASLKLRQVPVEGAMFQIFQRKAGKKNDKWVHYGYAANAQELIQINIRNLEESHGEHELHSMLLPVKYWPENELKRRGM